MTVREKLEAALAKPLVEEDGFVHSEVFDPWEDVITGIYGSYSSASDALMISAMEAVGARSGATFDFVKAHGFVAEFALYVLAGHGFTEYGTSPRGAWVLPEIADLWQPLIDKWKAHYAIVWKQPFEPFGADE